MSDPSNVRRSPAMRVARLTLSFTGKDAHLEDAFLDGYYDSSLKQIRYALLMAAVLYGIFGFLDATLVPDRKHILWWIRYAILCPVFLGAFVLSFTPWFRAHTQPIFLLLLLIGGLGIIGMILVAPSLGNSYYAGLMLVFMFGYTFIRARFVWATAAGWIIVAAYEVAAVVFTDISFPHLVSNNFLLISANVIGMVACYAIEYGARKDFYVAGLLAAEEEKVREANRALEDRVLERTQQLVEVNEGLKQEIEANRRAEEEKSKLRIQLRQSQKMEAIGTLAGGIAHDFNNILAAIMGSAEMTLLDLPSEGSSETRRHLDRILESSHRAKDLVNQILTFSRQRKPEVGTLSIGPIVTDGISMLRATLPRQIDIVMDLEADLDPIQADPTQIHRILMNLCTNAGHAMAAAGGTLTVGLANATITPEGAEHARGVDPGRYVRLTVQDTGRGIDAGIIERIFDPYFTTRKPGKGTGMGLAVIHGIVKSYGGAVTVESRPGDGALFCVFFPVVGAKKPTSWQPIPRAGVPPCGKTRILYVDDETFLVDLGSRMLEHLGHDVVATRDPLRALSTFEKTPDRFDLLITDMAMPHLNGAQLVEAVRRIRKDVPVIICTGFSEQIDEESVLQMGSSGYLMKPFSIDEMTTAIQSVLGESRGKGGAGAAPEARAAPDCEADAAAVGDRGGASRA